VITEAVLREFFADRCRVLAARARVPSPSRCFTAYIHHNVWHVLPWGQSLPFDSSQWIEVAW
jgi:hypothetical protein